MSRRSLQMALPMACVCPWHACGDWEGVVEGECKWNFEISEIPIRKMSEAQVDVFSQCCSGATFFTQLELVGLALTSRALRKVVLKEQPVVMLAIGQRIYRFDGDKIPLALESAKAIGVRVADLDFLHERLPGLQAPSVASKKGQWKHMINERWKACCAGREGTNHVTLMEAYHAFIRRVVGPVLRELGESGVWFSRLPIFRAHVPLHGAVDIHSEASGASDPTMSSLASIGKRKTGVTQGKRKGANRVGILTRLHRDGSLPVTPNVMNTGHPSGEINVWLPVSSHVWGTNSLWCDSNPWPWSNSSRKAFDLHYGEAVFFYGNACAHETVANDATDVTRCSLDFRFIAASRFEEKYERAVFSAKSNYYTYMAL